MGHYLSDFLEPGERMSYSMIANNKTKRNIVRVKLGYVEYCDFFDGNLTELIKRIEAKKEPGYIAHYVVCDGGCYDDQPTWQFYGERYENDDEYNKRVAKEKVEKDKARKARRTTEEKERKLYEKLRAKFEPAELPNP